ncbi:heme-binding protein 2-like isoform X2 [Haliotis rubra]|uniref:heme-binding protein 2-like isoform X2 n=1 Tax=Haliotis rubra TaxID=36100 RepID=UPI001EE5B3B7|nr:heme-binding protein 2-like isoform X2 [Haliotis rubra]
MHAYRGSQVCFDISYRGDEVRINQIQFVPLSHSFVMFRLRTTTVLNTKNQLMSGIFTAVKTAFTSKGLETPKYKVNEDAKHEGFEERRYEACKWVSTKVMAMTYKEGSSAGFRNLFNYISGDNEPKQKVEMTAPVATQVVPGAGPNCENTFTVSFYIPPEHQADPPKPTNPDVFISDWPEVKLAVKSFSGIAEEKDWINKGERTRRRP